MPVGQYVEQVRAATGATAAVTARCSVASADGLDHRGDELHFNGELINFAQIAQELHVLSIDPRLTWLGAPCVCRQLLASTSLG